MCPSLSQGQGAGGTASVRAAGPGVRLRCLLLFAVVFCVNALTARERLTMAEEMQRPDGVIGPLMDEDTGAHDFCLEAEDFVTRRGSWRRTWRGYFAGQPNYWSRDKLAADAGDAPAEAAQKIRVERGGRYRVWVHHEASYGFGQVFGVRIVQGGKVVFDGAYGRKEARKFFPHGRKWQVMGPWHWHSTELVYSGGETFDLEEGVAEVLLLKGCNQEPSGRRVIDFLFLTSDVSIKPVAGPGAWRGAGGEKNAPIISKFRHRVWFRAVLDRAPAAPVKLCVHARLFLNGYWRGPTCTHQLTREGAVRDHGRRGVRVPRPDKRAHAFRETFEGPWLRYDAPTIESCLFQVCADGPTDGIRFLVADSEPCDEHVIIDATFPDGRDVLEVVCAVGSGLYERGSLGDKKAMTFDELFEQQAERVAAFGAPGRRPRLFSALSIAAPQYPGYRDLFQAMGLNGQAGSVPPELYAPGNAERLGTRTDVGYISMCNRHLNRACYEDDFEAYAAQCRNRYEQLEADGFGAMRQNIRMIEEKSPPPLSQLRTWPKINARFRSYVRERGLTPKQLVTREALAEHVGRALSEDDLWNLVVLGTGTPEEAETHPELFYHSLRFRSWLYAETGRRAVLEVEKVFPEGTVANSGSIYPSQGNGPNLERGYNVFDLFRQRGVTCFMSEMSWGLCGAPDYLGPQSQSYEGTLARSVAKYHDVPMGTFQITAGIRGYSPQYVRLASFANVAQGMEFLYFYEIRLNCGSTSIVVPEVLEAIKTVNYGVGAVEADLMGVRARVVPAHVALGWSVTTDVWDLAVRKTHPFNLGQNIYPQERQQLYYLLRHCQVPVDILGEEDLIDGRLAGYRVYFHVGDHLSRKAAAALCEWVREEGTVIASAGGGLWDEYNEVNEEMLALFAIQSAPLERADVCLRPKLELLHRQPLDVADFGDARVEYNGFKQRIELAGDSNATVLAVNESGEPAALSHSCGKGRAVLMGFLPGYAYVKPAFPMRPFGRGGEEGLSNYWPTQFAPDVRAVVKEMLDRADVTSPVVCSNPLVEAVLLKGNDQGNRICLLNFAFEPQPNLRVKIRGIPWRRATDVATGKALPRSDGAVLVALDEFKVLRLE